MLSYQASTLTIFLPALRVARESKSKDCRQPMTSEETIGSSVTPIKCGLLSGGGAHGLVHLIDRNIVVAA